MSLTFNGTSSDGITESVAPVSTYPFTVSLWFNKPTTSLDILLSISNAAGTARILQITADGNCSFSRYNGTTFFGPLGTGYTVGAWTHIVVRVRSDSFIGGNLNGAAQTSDTTVASGIGAVDRIGYGRRNGAGANFLNGQLAEIGIWNVELSDEECTALAKGMPVRKIRPQAIVRDIRLIRDVKDSKGNPLTVTGTTVSSHPRIYP